MMTGKMRTNTIPASGHKSNENTHTTKCQRSIIMPLIFSLIKEYIVPVRNTKKANGTVYNSTLLNSLEEFPVIIGNMKPAK